MRLATLTARRGAWVDQHRVGGVQNITFLVIIAVPTERSRRWLRANCRAKVPHSFRPVTVRLILEPHL